MKGQRRGSVKFASTLSALDSVEAFPTSRSTFTSTTQSASSPRQASKAAAAAAARLSAQPEEDTPRQQHQPQSDVPSARYRPLNRFSSNLRSTATTTTLTKEERRISDDHLQQYQPKSVAPSRPAKYRKAGARSFNKPPVVDPIDESSRGFERTEPELAIQQRSISNQNGRPINQYSARRPAVRLDHDRVTTTTERSRDEASSSFNPSKPTRRTFTRKPIVATTTPANRRTTKRYQNNKKNNSLKVETSSIQSPASSRYSTSSAPEVSVKPFRVATRHQGQQLKAKGQKNFQKFDDAVEEDNYPEHFKLLLKNKPPQQQQEGKLKASSPTKAFRGSNREAVTEPQIEPEKKVHSVLRKPNKVRQRPVLSQRISSPTTTTTTEVYLPIIEDLATDLPLLDDENDREENSIDPEEDDRQFPSRFRESAEKFSREFVTEDLLYRNEPPKRGFAQPSTIQPVGFQFRHRI